MFASKKAPHTLLQCLYNTRLSLMEPCLIYNEYVILVINIIFGGMCLNIGRALVNGAHFNSHFALFVFLLRLLKTILVNFFFHARW